MTSSKLSLKLFLKDATTINLEHLVPIFHSWIQMHAIPDHLLIDVADYSHVHNGPGIALIAHEANIYFDQRDGQPGLTYQRKLSIEGTLAERIRTILAATQQAAALLEQSPALEGQARFRTDEIELRIHDRLQAPNAPETFQAIKPALLEVWPGARLRYEASEHELLRVTITLAEL